MPKPVFFPDPVFGWLFFSVLVGLLAVAAVIDIRTTRIPKRLTLTIAAAGLLANIIRGIWLGNDHQQTWQLDPGSFWLGGLDGLEVPIGALDQPNPNRRAASLGPFKQDL